MRRPRPEEADAIAQVHNRGWAEAYSHLLPKQFFDAEALDRRRAMWRSVLRDADSSTRLWVAATGARLVGVAFAGPSPDEEPARSLQLYVLYVLARYHGTGVGQGLLDAALGDAPAQLWVAKDNPRAHAFYRKNGFQPDGTEKPPAHPPGIIEVRFVR